MEIIPIRHIKEAQKATDATENFSIRQIRDLLNGKDLVQVLHRHDFFFILVLQKGKGTHEIDFNSYKVHDNLIFIMRPGQVHKLKLKVGCTGYLVQFNPTLYPSNEPEDRQLLSKATSKNNWQFDANGYKKLLPVLQYIFHEFHDQQEGYQEIIKASLRIFLIEFNRHRQVDNSPSEPVFQYRQERTEELLNLLHTDVTKHKTVSHYAERLSLSIYQLNAITRSTLGKSCSELIDDFILLESKRFLLATSNQVTQIAYHLGYEDVSYFIRFFKKHTGYSPDAFRHKS